MTEPVCCGEPMVHNSFTSEYECPAAYFSLVDDGLLYDGGGLRIDLAQLPPPQRAQYDHWRASCVPDGAPATSPTGDPADG